MFGDVAEGRICSILEGDCCLNVVTVKLDFDVIENATPMRKIDYVCEGLNPFLLSSLISVCTGTAVGLLPRRKVRTTAHVRCKGVTSRPPFTRLNDFSHIIFDARFDWLSKLHRYSSWR